MNKKPTKHSFEYNESMFKDFIECCQHAIVESSGRFLCVSELEEMTLLDFSIAIATKNSLFIKYRPNEKYRDANLEFINDK